MNGHEACPGNGLCCNRPEFDRALFPCSVADVWKGRTEAAEKRVAELEAQLAAERERCAQVVESLQITDGGDPNSFADERVIAAAIRKGSGHER